MSHFCVYVMGNDVERLLAPYEEFECSGDNTPYVRDIDITEEVRKKFKENEDYDDIVKFCEDELEMPSLKEGNEPDIEGDHKYEYFVVNEKGEFVKAVNRTNPDSRWDCWQIGGRFGLFLLKDGSDSAQAMKKDIDFAAMQKTRAEKAAKLYDEIHTILFGPGSNAKTFEELLKIEKGRYKDNDVALYYAREVYNTQPELKALRELKPDMWFGDVVEKFSIPRERYIHNAAMSAIVPFAFISENGEWNEKGTMGWWAMVANEKEDDLWNSIFLCELAKMSDNTLLTIVDCHI